MTSNFAHGEVYLIQHYVIKFDNYSRQVWWFPPGTTIYSNKNTDVHDITKLLLKVALDTITITLTLLYYLARYTNKHKIQHIYIELMQRNVLLINVIIYLLKICLILHM